MRCEGERRIEKVFQVLELGNLVNHGAICWNGKGWMRSQEFCLGHF